MTYRILITDDDALLMSAYQAILKKDTCLAVDFATSPAEALTFMAASHYDAALLDIELSDETTTGLDLLNHLKQRDPATAVLMMSSKDDAATVAQCRRLGAANFSSKNHGFLTTLRAQVMALLNLPRMPA